MTQKAYSLLEIKAFDDDLREIRGIATTPSPDRVDDIVEPLGMKFAQEMPFLLHHDRSLPVGTVRFGKPTKNGIPFTAIIPKVAEDGIVKMRVDEAWHSVKYKLITAVSIGFRCLNGAYESLKSGGIRYLETECLELSLVTIPANADATITSVKSLADAQAATMQCEKAGAIAKLAGAPANKTVVTLKRQLEKPKMSKYAEQIKGFEACIDDNRQKMQLIAEKADGRSFDAAEAEEFDTCEAEIKAASDQIVRLKRLMELDMSTAKAVDGTATNKAASDSRAKIPAQAKVKESLEPGVEFTRFFMCVAANKGDLSKAARMAEQRYPASERLNLALRAMNEGGVNFGDMHLKAAIAAGSSTDSTWAQPLIAYNQFSGDFVNYLRPQTIVGKFGQGGIPAMRSIPFNVHVRGQTSGGTAYWVGQGQPAPLTKFDFNDVEMSYTKLATISTITEELLRLSNPSAEILVRDSLRDAIVEKIDQTFIDPAIAAVSSVSPASITNGVTAIVSSGNTADNIRTDVKAAMSTFIADNNTPTSGVWIMSATVALSLSLMRNALGQKEFPEITMLGGRFEGLPVIVSEYIEPGLGGSYVVLANASDIWLADDGMVTVDASNQVSLQMLDNPTNSSVSATAATSMVSMWQTGTVAYKAERWINWKKRRSSAVAYISDVNWGDA